jgi:hypothetical protein
MPKEYGNTTIPLSDRITSRLPAESQRRINDATSIMNLNMDRPSLEKIYIDTSKDAFDDATGILVYNQEDGRPKASTYKPSRAGWNKLSHWAEMNGIWAQRDTGITGTGRTYTRGVTFHFTKPGKYVVEQIGEGYNNTKTVNVTAPENLHKPTPVQNAPTTGPELVGGKQELLPSKNGKQLLTLLEKARKKAESPSAEELKKILEELKKLQGQQGRLDAGQLEKVNAELAEIRARKIIPDATWDSRRQIFNAIMEEFLELKKRN